MVPIVIETIASDEYVRRVLPQTFALWGHKRTFEKYAGDFREVADSPYGRRRPFTVGLREGDAIAASCKNYDRELRAGSRSLRAVGIGAVFTPPELRGRGYATAMLGAFLDDERAKGGDVAFLFSDIHPAFYARLGFIALPSRLITIRAASLDGAHSHAEPLDGRDWPAVRRCFDATDTLRPWSFRRTPVVWDWMKRGFNASAPEGTQNVQLVVRRGRGLIAYALGRRVFRQDAFVLDDFAFDGEEGRAVIQPLLRAAAGDLRRIAGWLPPAIAREALPRGSVRPRKDAFFMIAPLSTAARAWWKAAEADTLKSRADPVWDADHV